MTATTTSEASECILTSGNSGTHGGNGTGQKVKGGNEGSPQRLLRTKLGKHGNPTYESGRGVPKWTERACSTGGPPP